MSFNIDTLTPNPRNIHDFQIFMENIQKTDPILEKQKIQ